MCFGSFSGALSELDKGIRDIIDSQPAFDRERLHLSDVSQAPAVCPPMPFAAGFLLITFQQGSALIEFGYAGCLPRISSRGVPAPDKEKLAPIAGFPLPCLDGLPASSHQSDPRLFEA